MSRIHGSWRAWRAAALSCVSPEELNYSWVKERPLRAAKSDPLTVCFPERAGRGCSKAIRALEGRRNTTLNGRLHEIIFDPPVLYGHAVKRVPAFLPAPTLLGARRLCFNVFRRTISRKRVSAFWAARCLSLSEPAPTLTWRQMRFHLRSNLRLRTLHTVWPTLAPAGENSGSSAALAICV